MNYESFLKTSLAKYQNADFVKNEVLNAIEIFSDLIPKLGKAGKTYNTPICVWILDDHPYQAPLANVTPTSSMYITQSNSVDVNGRVCTDYLKKWQHPNSNLLGFLFDLTEVFGRDPPLSTIIPGSESEYIAKLKLSNYTQALKTKQDAIGIVNVFPGLKANMQERPFVDGTSKLVLSLEGTIPVVYRGLIYHTPVSLHLMEQHPYQPPVVYVKPSPGARMNISRYVDVTGKVYTPYLAEWNYPGSDLLSLVQEMTVIFGTTPPLFTNSKTEQTNMTTRNTTSHGEEFIAKLQLKNYTQALETKQDAIRSVNVFPHLTANMQEVPFTDGTRKLVLSLEGTIPVDFNGQMYNTPVCVRLMEQHPYQAPEVYVKPPPGMNVSRYVDKSGKVHTPYLAEWNYSNSDLLSMIQEVTVIFGKTPPLFAISKTEQTSMKTRNFTSPGQLKSVSSVQSACSDNAPGDDTRADTAKLDSGQVLGRVVVGMDELNLGSAEDFDIHCDPCNVESSFVEAEGFCIDCKEYYCKACLKYHRKISATKSHKILLKDKMPKP